jgi:putative ABC transport system permease protein
VIGRPPAAATWLLARLLDGESYEAVAGDLDEEFCRVAAARGRAAAARWYWRAAAQSVVSCRITGRRVAEARRMDFDAGPRLSARDLLRPALRQFRDHPIYAVATSGTLALAIGVGCASFAVVKRAFLDPLPYPDDRTLVSLLTEINGDTSAVSPHVLEDLRGSRPPLTAFAAIRPRAFTYVTDQGTETALGNLVTADYFALLGVAPAMGRTFSDREPDAALVSWRFWNERLGADPAVIGRSIMLDGRARVVTGVLSPDFFGPYWSTAEVWLPLDMAPLMADVRQRRPLTILARRAAGTSQASLDAFMTVFSSNLQRRHPAVHGNQAWVAVPLRDELVGRSRPALLGAGAAAILLLLIVAANIAGLSTAHAAATTHHVAIRAALGATRGRLFAEQLTEILVLALAGSVAGIWLARFVIQILTQYQEQFLGRLARFALDPVIVICGIAAGLVIGVTAALVPRSVIHTQPSSSLRAARGSSASVRLTRLRGGLVIAQVALALVLLVGAGLVVRTVSHLAALDLGFNPDGLAVAQINLPGQRYESRDAQLEFERAVVERVSQIPGVESASASVGFPIVGGMMAGLVLRGEPADAAAHEIAYLSVAPDFLPQIGARLIAGRPLSTGDRAHTAPVVVINEAMARLYWPQGNAIGSQVHIGPGTPDEAWITIVGVVADMRTHGPTEIVRPAAYGSTWQYSWPRRHISVRTAPGRMATLGPEVRAAIRAVDPGIPAATLTPVHRMISDRTASHRLISLALTLFSGVALVLCICGLYAVVALTSRLRRREYAVRIALGARGEQVRLLVLRHAFVLVAAGTALGIAGAAVSTRILTGFLHGVTPIDPPVFAGAAALLIALATAAAWQPARHAGRVDPVETLKAE